MEHIEAQLSLHGQVAAFIGGATSGFANGGAAWLKLSRYFWDAGYELKSKDDTPIGDVVEPVAPVGINPGRDPWRSEPPIRSCGHPVVLVDEPAEQVPPADIARVDRDRLSARREW